MLLNEAIAPLNDSRFVPFKIISEWNGKFNSTITQPFYKSTRDTDIPGTIINKNLQRNGPDHDIFIDCNPDAVKRSLNLGMV